MEENIEEVVDEHVLSNDELIKLWESDDLIDNYDEDEDVIDDESAEEIDDEIDDDEDEDTSDLDSMF